MPTPQLSLSGSSIAKPKAPPKPAAAGGGAAAAPAKSSSRLSAAAGKVVGALRASSSSGSPSSPTSKAKGAAAAPSGSARKHTGSGTVAAAPAVEAAAAAAAAPQSLDAPLPVPPLLPPPPPPPPPPNPHAGPGSVQILYNHYKEVFPTMDGRLAALDIDRTYCFHAAYKGEYRLHLHACLPAAPPAAALTAAAGGSTGRLEGPRAEEEVVAPPAAAAPAPQLGLAEGAAEDEGGLDAAAAASAPLEPGVHAGPFACGHVVFTGLPHGAVFKVVVEDDALYAPKGAPPPIRFLTGGGAQGEGHVERTGRAGPEGLAGGVGVRSRGVQELTAELKGLAVEDLKGEKYKALLEAREIELALFSGGGLG